MSLPNGTINHDDENGKSNGFSNGIGVKKDNPLEPWVLIFLSFYF